MADVEMDLDPSRSMESEDHIGRDIIEYDLDTDAMDGTHNEWAAEDLEIRDVDESHEENEMDAHVHMETLLHDITEHPVDIMDTLDMLPFSGTSGNDADMLSDLGHGANLSQEDAEQLHDADTAEDTVVDISTTEQQTPREAAHEPDETEEAPAQPLEEGEEIDFGTAPEEEVGVESSLFDDLAPQGVNKTAVDHDLQVEKDIPTTVAATEEQGTHPVEEELTWEDDDEEGVPTATLETVTDELSTDKSSTLLDQLEVSTGFRNGGEMKAEEQLSVDEPAGGENSESAEAAVPQEQPQVETKVTHEQKYERDEVQEVPLEATPEDAPFPSITVQYKGEEFPCFASSDGFFTSTTVLEESMERLLAGFRGELAAELAPDEELVFHIDELGLEFTESTQHDILAGTTLQYVLEIYEMLLQNQDHDHEPGSKTLYTYLFTRSSTSKRLEFLSDSAASGKGLDEVIHLFEPAMAHHDVEQSSEDTPAFLGEQGDDYPSPGEQPIQDDGGYDSGADPALVNSGASYEEKTADRDVQETEVVDTVDHVGETTLVQSTGDEFDSPAKLDAGRASSQSSGVETNYRAPEQQGQAEPQQEMDPTELETLEVGGEPTEYDEGTEQAIEAPTTATSTSSTLDGAEIPPLASIGEYAESRINATITEPSHKDNEAEIDWREDGDEQEDEDAIPDGQTTPAKRARADDDELGLDEENDAKRHRSS